MNVLILKKFNNYANRIVLRYETLLDYQQRASSFLTFSNINFNPNDGVNTTIVLGSPTQQEPTEITSVTEPLSWENFGSPDYLICYEEPLLDESDDSSDEPTEIILSRWFVIECKRTRLGQYELSLKRDTIAEHLTAVEDATCFIEKGTIEDFNDPALYNTEPITTNQIKSDEFLLKDETQCPWIVGYVAKDRENNGTLTPITFSEQTIAGPTANDSACAEIYADENAFWAAHTDLVGDLALLQDFNIKINLDVLYQKLWSKYTTGQNIYFKWDFLANMLYWSCEEAPSNENRYLHSDGNGNAWCTWTQDWRDEVIYQVIKNMTSWDFANPMRDQIASKENVKFIDRSVLQSFNNYINKGYTIKIGSKYYQLYDIYEKENEVKNSTNVSIGSSCYDLLMNTINFNPKFTFTIDGNDLHNTGPIEATWEDHIVGTPGSETFNIEWNYEKHAIGLREVFGECKAKIPLSYPVLKEAPYYMFAIPYADDLALYNGDTLYCKTNKSVAMNAAQQLAQQSGVGVVYDVQLLPYCPIRDIIKTEKVTEHAEFPVANEDNRRVILPGIPQPAFGAYSFFKLNTQYVLSKNISWTRTIGQQTLNQYGFALRSSGTIYIKVGEDNLENPTTYTCKRFEVIKPNADASEDAKIRLWADKLPTQGATPIAEFSYNNYVAGNNIIGIYLTSDFDQGGYGENLSHTIAWDWLSSTGFPFSILGARQSRPRVWTTGYIYYEDYYLTKLDISNVTYSNIAPVLSGVEGEPVNVIFWCTDSQFSFNKYLDNYFLLQADSTYKQDAITDLINEKVKRGQTITDIKVRNQTDMLRLAAPNYSNFFDINIQKNEGIEYINVDCTYKPYQPYMHLNPNFKGLYGADYNDVRGLICGGDYSIATTTDAWATYQLQNKNYQAIFDRQMQHLETQQGIERDAQTINATLGYIGAGIGGATTGALAGAKLGGGYGAAAGALIGGVAGTTLSGIGASADLMNAQRLRELQISTTKDIHAMQLENIKALPLGLSKTSYLTNNNKLFPFLEFYTCTSKEDTAVRDYLNYNGMTINRIGKIRDFQSDEKLPYIKAQLLRINLTDDAHHVKDIANELAMGIYIPEGDSEDSD